MAIAFVGAASSPGYSATNTLSVSVPAGVTLLVAYIRNDQNALTSVTFNGIALTIAGGVGASGGNYWIAYLPAPPVGTFTLVVNVGGNSCGFTIAEYSGTRSDASVLRNFTNNGSAASVSLVNDIATGGSWGIMGAGDRTGVDPTANTNCVRRTSPGGGASIGLFDTNGPQAFGAFSMSATAGAGPAAVGICIAPATAAVLEGQAGFRVGATANMGVGGINFAAQPGLQLSGLADLSPGYRPPAFLLPSGYETLEDNAGQSVPGGLVWTYLAGTSTPAPTYTDSTLTVVNSNPIVCDAAGRWTAWVAIGTAYKLVFETPATPPAHGATIKTVDGVQVLTYPVWVSNPYNPASFTATGSGAWTVEPGDVLAYQFMIDGKRLFLSLQINNTSITGAVTQVKVALPAGIITAGWQQVGATIIYDNASTGVLGAWIVNANSAAVFLQRADTGAFAASTNLTSFWLSAVIAIS